MKSFQALDYLLMWFGGWALVVTLVACHDFPDNAPVQELNPVGDLPLVQVYCGERPLRMGADSGSELPLALFADAAAELAAAADPKSATTSCPQPLCARPGSPPLSRVYHLALGGHAPMEGLMGWPILRRRIWHLDLANRRHHFADAVPEHVVRTWHCLPLKRAEHATLHIPGLGDCMLDTGAPNAVYLPTPLWQELTAALPDLPKRYYYGQSPAAGGAFLAECAEFPVLQLGCLVLRHVLVCESFCERPEIILGCDFLRCADLWLDAPQQRAYLRPLSRRMELLPVTDTP